MKIQMKREMAVLVGALLVVLLCGGTALATPSTMMVEGALQSVGGGPAADGVYDVAFALYSVKTGGTATWMEGPTKLEMKGGRFIHTLGIIKPFNPDVLAALPAAWLGVTIGDDPQLKRVPMHAVAYALHAKAAAKLNCTGCIKSANVATGAIGANKVGFPFAGAKTKGGPATTSLDLQCTGCVTVKEMKFDQDVDLGGNALKAAKVAAQAVAAGTVQATTFLGDGSKLSGIKIPSGECKIKGEVVKGINADGTLKCIKAMDPSALPGDGIDEISNDLIHNQFQNTDCTGKTVPIKDNNPIGAHSELNFGNYGLAQKLDVLIDVSNSDMKTVIVKLWDSNNVEYLLWNKTAGGAKLSGVWPSKTKVLKGDLTSWVNKNPKGKWRIQVIDGKFLNNGNDGAITKFCVNIQTLSNQKVQVKGDLIVDGTITSPNGLKVDGTIQPGKAGTCDASRLGSIAYDAKKGLLACQKNVQKNNSIKYAWMAAAPAQHIFQGGCKSHNQGGGWTRYCLNGVDYNTAQNYLTHSTNGRLTAKISGFYHIRFYALQHGCGHQHMAIRINGGQKAYGYWLNDSKSNQWTHHTIEYLARLRVGDYMEPWAYHDGCGNQYKWHAWNPNGSHSRVTAKFVGPYMP